MLFLLLCPLAASAQDVIVKKDGSTIVCRIVEVNQTEVVYKRWANLNGPNYVMNLSDLSAINYENGEKIRFEAQTQGTPPSTASILNGSGQQTVSDDALLRMAGKSELTPSQKKAKRMKVVGWIGGSTLIVTGVMLFGASSGYGGFFGMDDMRAGIYIPGIASFLGGIAWIGVSQVKARKLEKDFQYSVQSSPIFQNDFTLKNGTTLSTGIDMLRDNARHNPTLGVGLSYNF